MIDRDGFIKLPEAPPPPVKRKIVVGAKVRIASGPFGGWQGLYSGQSTKDRERILLHVLGGQRVIRIASNLVVPQ